MDTHFLAKYVVGVWYGLRRDGVLGSGFGVNGFRVRPEAKSES